MTATTSTPMPVATTAAWRQRRWRRAARGEDCDDGNNVETDGCRKAVARRPAATAWFAAEACDDGNEVQTDACLNDCTAARCGDGLVQAGVEACDDGNEVQTDACLNSCAVARCGDAFVQAGVEACDDGNQVQTDVPK